jgi:murein DD-endopeptidase MepM/ murein hydrolase activator NlpD
VKSFGRWRAVAGRIQGRRASPAPGGPAAVSLAAALVALLVAAGAGARPLLKVTITSKPSDPTTSLDASFAFSSDARDATFTCSLDGARATTCRSPASYTRLSLARHTFVVVAIRGREQASARYDWTVEAPKPMPPKTAQLLVVVSGGGSVSSSVAGIACPPDCSEAYPLGTAVTLTPAAGAGFTFSGWHGGCSGSGGCTATIAGTTYIEAVFLPTAKPPTLFRGDVDKDGVPNARDGCLATSRGLKALLHGCAATDLVLGGSALLDDLEDYDYPGGYADRFDGVAGLKPIHRGLVQNLALMRRGARQVEDGGVCDGAALLGRGAAGLRALVGKSKKTITAMQVAVSKKPSGHGDVDVKDFEWAGLHHLQGIVAELAADATKVQKGFGAACASLGPRIALTGVVTETDDANGLLVLASGALVQLPGGEPGNDVAEGSRIRVAGKRGQGGRVFAESVTTLGKALPTPDIGATPCVSLLIAPVQPFSKPSHVLHDPRGYEAQDVLWLEERMRVAASPESCADKGSFRYSLAVEATAQGWPKKTIAPDLDALDDPVPLGISASQSLWTLTVTLRRQGNNCPPPSDQPLPLLRALAAVSKSYPCPIVPVGTTTYKARVRSFASYGTAVYEKTGFDLESNAFAPGKVTGVTALHATIASPGFEADGYQITGTQSAAFMSKIVKNQQFAVWPEAWYGFPLVFPLDSVGVGHYAGLVWPRVVGTRHGKPFRYAAQLPLIVIDLLPGCPAGNCFYRLPWKAGDTVETGQGNGPNAFSHTGNQQFAFDFSMPDKSTIYATRGGVVGDVVESNTLNFNPCVNGPNADGPSNFVRIDHQDGTFSYYAHVDTNSVIPAEGTTVARGAQLAKVDNIGRSCGPHLHYQVAIDSTNTIYGQTTQICFEGWALVIFDWLYSSCFIPKTNNLLISTNS